MNKITGSLDAHSSPARAVINAHRKIEGVVAAAAGSASLAVRVQGVGVVVRPDDDETPKPPKAKSDVNWLGWLSLALNAARWVWDIVKDLLRTALRRAEVGR